MECRKAKKVECSKNDRISFLPEEVLSYILSLSPIEKINETSLLSKRWRNIWKSVPIIQIKDHTSRDPDWGFKYYYDPHIYEPFMEFVDQLLSLNEVSCLQKIQLNLHNHYPFYHVDKLFGIVFARDIEELRLNVWEEFDNFESSGPVILPLNLCNKKNLVKLRLGNKIVMNVSPSFYLPRLKIVQLHFIESLNNDSVKILVAGCPVLEELEIFRHGDQMDTLFVQSSSLKIFRLVFFDNEFKVKNDISCILDATHLEEIDVNINSERFTTNSLPSLIKAKLHLFTSTTETEGGNANLDPTVGIIRYVANTKRLFLANETTYALGYSCLDGLPVFRNLTHLGVEMHYCRQIVFASLLESSPVLISLILYRDELSCSVMGRNKICSGDECDQQFHTCECLMLYLERIELHAFQGCAHEIEMVSYFLKNSPVLKKMCFKDFWGTPTEESNFRDQISKLPSTSTDCEIGFFKKRILLEPQSV